MCYLYIMSFKIDHLTVVPRGYDSGEEDSGSDEAGESVSDH